jgi:signal transduction histidine kinase
MIHRLAIRTRVLLAYTLLFGVILSLFAALIYEAVRDERFSKLGAMLESQAEKLHSEIEEQRDRRIFPVLRDLSIIRTEGLEKERFQLFDTTGNVIVSDTLLKRLPVTVTAHVLSGKMLRQRVTVSSERYEVLWVPLEIDGPIQYVLEVAAPITEIDVEMARLRLLLLVAIPLTLLITGFAAAAISRSAFRPVTAMIHTAKAITAANLKQRIAEPEARDEMRLLATTLNDMIHRLDAAFESQKQFVADASHELRTPLTVIRSELEFAERKIQDPSAKESLVIAFAEIDRLARIAEGLLMLARMDASQFRLSLSALRLDELVIECVQAMRSTSDRKGVKLELRIESAVELEGDRERLKSVVLNLLDNAIKFSPSGEVVSLSLEAENSPWATLTVSDHGPGIAPEELPHLFKRFYQSEMARSESQGSGLGLAIVEKIVNLHGGTVSVESHVGGGASFTIRLMKHQSPGST